MTAVDAANGNYWAANLDDLLIVQNTDASPRSIQVTSQPQAETGRTGHVNQSLAAGEIRVFRFARDGWATSDNKILLPTGMNANLKCGIVKLG
jgi:hypothetical protein